MTINQDGKYFNVHIENDHYYITRSTEKQGKDSAITNLKNIEEILSKHLTYAPDHKDNYAKMSDGDRFKLLKNESDQIINNHEDKVKSNIFYRIFSHKKEIKALHKNILNILNPAEKIALESDVIQNVLLKYLPISDLMNLHQLNRASDSTKDLTTELANEFGYVQKGNKLTAKEYLKELFDEVDKLHKEKLISEKYIVYLNKEKGSIDTKQTLLNLKKLSDDDLIHLLSYRRPFGSHTIFANEADKILNIINFKGKVLNLNKSSKDTCLKAEIVLLWSAQNNKKELLECLVKSGVDLETKAAPSYDNRYSSKPLELAIAKNHPEIVKILLVHGADSSLALNKAVKLKNDDMVKFLLDEGVENSGSVLLDVIKLNNFPMLKLILEKNIEGLDVNYRTPPYGVTPLLACFDRLGDPATFREVELLLKYGADPAIRDRSGYLALDYATTTDIKKLIDSYGTKYFDVHIENNQFYITQSQLKPKNGFALSALENIEKALIQGLTYNSAHENNSPRLAPNLTNEQALVMLAEKADEIARNYKNAVAKSVIPESLTNEKEVNKIHERIKMLIVNQTFNISNLQKTGFDLSTSNEATQIKAEIILSFAADLNKKDLVEYLIKSGVDPEIQRIRHNSNYRTPLETAIINNKPEIVEVLLDGRADSSKALKQAVKLNNEEIVNLLLDKGVKNSGSILLDAIELDNFSMLKLILDRKIPGLDVNYRDPRNGNTLLLACYHQPDRPATFREIDLLLKHGADASIPDRKGRLPIDFARTEKGRKHIDRYGTKYFDVHIEGDQFYITQSQLKPRNGFALSALENIEKALVQGLTYNSAHEDNSPRLPRNLTNDNVIKFLGLKADEIAGKYETAVTDSILVRSLTDEKKVKETHERIKRLIKDKNLQ